jgi:hypothetical protein
MIDLLSHFLRTIHREYFMGFPLWRMEDGRFAGEFFKVRLESRFRPVVDVHAEPLGRVAELLAITPGRENIGEQVLTRLTRVSESPVVLDRFIRCLHLLNHLCEQGPLGRLFLPVSTVLLERVSHEHGKVFRQILDTLELAPRAVGFLLPAALASSQPTLSRLQENYERHGIDAYLPVGELAGDTLAVRTLHELLTEQPVRRRRA